MTEAVANPTYDRKVNSVLERIEPLLSKLGYKSANASADPDDIASEIRVKVLMNLRNNQSAFQILPIDDLVAISITVARNYNVDLIRKSVRRPDTSKFSQRIEEQDLSTFSALSIWGNQESRVIAKSVYAKLLTMALQEPRIGSDLVKFIRELVQPSKYTLIFYSNWKQLTSELNPHKNKSTIPAEVIGKALGFSPSKVSRLKERIQVLLVKLGYETYEIFANAYEYPAEWYASQGISGPERFVQQVDRGIHNPVRPGVGTVPASQHGEGRHVDLSSCPDLVAELERKVNEDTAAGKFARRW